MHAKYPNIFKPLRLGPVEVPNRLYYSPHATPQTTPTGGPTEDYSHYILARAKGGCGLIILSMSALERSRFVQPSSHPRENVEGWGRLADEVHEAGAKLFGELWYWWGAAGPWSPFSPPAPSMSASAVPYGLFENRTTTREMSRTDISSMVGAFRQSAANLREAGFDGVMLHASHGAVPEQFLSPYFNRRTDEYGGPLENRMRFLNEVLDAIREEVGDTMAVGARINCDELLEGGYGTSEAFRIVENVAASGRVDFFDLDIAIEPDQYYIGMPPVFTDPHPYLPYVEAVRGAAGDYPVLSVMGRLTSIADADGFVASGVCDMVGAARALIAEPDLVRNAYEGKEDRSRTCIACNWCMACLYFDGTQSCTINPASWRERHWGTDKFAPAVRPSKVTIVGSGPAGLEAARVSALRGHDVALIEARDRLGGGLALWASLPGREFYLKAVDWWQSEIERLGVKVDLGVTATAETILARQPDAVILATGARYSTSGRSNHRDLDIAGHDRDFVYRPEEILLGNIHPKGKVVVLDAEGIQTGVGIAELLALHGADVEFVSPGFAPLAPRVIATQHTHHIMTRLRAAGVTMTQTSYIKSIGDHEVTLVDVYSDEERVVRDVAAVVLSTSRVPANELERQLEGNVPQLFTVGDAASPRMFAVASFEGQKFARYIGEPGAPASIGEVYFKGGLSEGAGAAEWTS